MLAIAAAGPQTMIRTTALVAALAIAGAAHAASPRDSLVVTPAWLAEHASDANLVILHAGAAAEYQAAHIAGARLVTQADISAAAADSNGLSLELPSAAVLHDQLEALGISNTSRIVVEYAQGQIQAATRIIFTLDAAGLGDKVSLLDGGLSAWTKEGRTVTAEATPSKTGALAALKMQPHIVDAAFIQAHAATPGYDLIDARATNFYDGSQAGAAQGANPKKGHIPGAKSLPFTSVSNPDMTLKSPEQLAQAFAAAGIRTGDHVMVYCHVGQQATAVVVAARTLGIDAALYDGSFQDWSARNLPVEGPAAAAG